MEKTTKELEKEIKALLYQHELISSCIFVINRRNVNGKYFPYLRCLNGSQMNSILISSTNNSFKIDSFLIEYNLKMEYLRIINKNLYEFYNENRKNINYLSLPNLYYNRVEYIKELT